MGVVVSAGEPDQGGLARCGRVDDLLDEPATRTNESEFADFGRAIGQAVRRGGGVTRGDHSNSPDDTAIRDAESSEASPVSVGRFEPNDGLA